LEPLWQEGIRIPEACRQVKVTFIPKPRKANTNYAKTKAYYPVNLSLFMLKMMEKLGDRHSRDEILRLYRLYKTSLPTREVH
jgi:hypothetical protein